LAGRAGKVALRGRESAYRSVSDAITPRGPGTGMGTGTGLGTVSQLVLHAIAHRLLMLPIV